MIYGNQTDRIKFVIELVYELDNIQHELTNIDGSIEKESEVLYQNLLAKNQSKINDEIKQYKNNLEQITLVNNDITRQINSWYSFTNEPDNKTTVLFPLKFHTKKKRLQRNIKKANEKISELTINNRFLKEKLHNHELELEDQSLRKMEQCNSYKNYVQLTSTKKNIIILLKTLIPTIEGLCPVEADISNLAPLLARLETALLENPSAS